MNPSHIYYFAHYSTRGPCVRYRGKYFLQELKKTKGITFSFVFPNYSPLNIINFIKIYFSILFFRKKNSIIILQKIYTRGIYATSLKILLFFRRENTIYDLDDAYHLKFCPETIYYFLKKSSCISVGSQSLKELAEEFNRNVFLNTSPVISHTNVKRNRNSLFTIGWVGFYNAHRESLEQLVFPGLLILKRKIKLTLMGVTKEEHRFQLNQLFPENSDVMLEMPLEIDWENEESVYKMISEFDVGIAPLLSTGINHAKSAFKLKQYLSAGVPVLASPIGENRNFLKDGLNGFFCNSPEEFAEMIEKLIDMKDHNYSALSHQALSSTDAFTMEKYCCTFLEKVSS